MSDSNTPNQSNMIQKDDYGEILTRIKQIKSLFAFGEGILPFLEELFIFLREVSPLLNEVSDSIMNTTGMMPDAAIELETAVAETSDATFKIMDHVEGILSNMDNLEQLLANADEDASKELLLNVRNDAHAIMTALQFHDIVSQKLVHVKKVLAEIQQKMLNLFTKVHEMNIDTDIKENILLTFGINIDVFNRIMENKINVDKHMTAQDTRQEKQPKPPTAAEFNQNDIDDLFG